MLSGSGSLRGSPHFVPTPPRHGNSTTRTTREAVAAGGAGSRVHLVLAILLLSATAALAALPFSSPPQFCRRALGEASPAELLVTAANCDDLEGVQRALDEGVAPDGTDDAYAPLDLADDPAVVRLLLARGANPSELRCRATPLGCAVIRGNLAVVKILLDAGANPNLHDPRSASPLECARMRGHADIARLLLERGATSAAQPDGAAGATSVAQNGP
jgi:uncharacterized protein